MARHLDYEGPICQDSCGALALVAWSKTENLLFDGFVGFCILARDHANKVDVKIYLMIPHAVADD
eukprot:6112406-Karenia_brevis.AAC.1